MSNDSGTNPRPAGDPLRYRSADLITAILDAVYDPDDPDPIPWADLVHAFTSDRHQPRTIEATLYDLVAFGALHRIGQTATRHRADTRAVKGTTLGRAWWHNLDQPERPRP